MELIQLADDYVFVFRKRWQYSFEGDLQYTDYYDRSKRFWNTGTKAYETTKAREAEEIYYMPGYEVLPGSSEQQTYMPLNELVDTYVMPRTPGSPGYIDGYQGLKVNQRSDGNGYVYPEYGNAVESLVVVARSGIAPLKGQTEGKVKVTVTGGQGQLRFTIFPSGFIQYANSGEEVVFDKVPDTYTVYIVEENPSTSDPVVPIFTVVTVPERVIVKGCTNPAALNYNADAEEDDGTCQLGPPTRKRSFQYPIVNSLRMVLTQATNNYSNFADYDNTLFCETDYYGRNHPGYHQKFVFNDDIVTQFRSNYATHVVKLRRHGDGSEVATMPVTKKVQYTGLPQNYEGWITPDTTAGRVRVYFNSLTLPIALAGGDTITLVNTPGFDGTYLILDVANDADMGAPYVTFSHAYDVAVGPRIDTTVQSVYDMMPYDVHEFSLGLDLRAPGEYYVQLIASDPEFATIEYKSEPFLLQEDHPGTHCLRYRNNDDAFDITYSTGITHVRRVESDTFKRYTGGNRTVHRNPNNTVKILQAQPRRMFSWETFKLPPWLHEVLAVALDHDYVELDGMRVVCEEGYQKPAYINLYTLSDSVAELEVSGFLGVGNGNDLGDIDGVGSGYMVVKRGYLKKSK